MTPRELCLAMYRAALAAAEPARAVDTALRAERLISRRIHVLALGKAAVAMTEGALEVLRDRVVALTIVAPRGAEARALPAHADVIFARHPIPDDESVRGGRALLAAASRVPDGDLALVLLSGGASSLAESPAPTLGREDIERTTALLLTSGAPIAQLNAVRKHLSSLKAGGLLTATRAEVVTLALSDVSGEPPSVIGSGPTSADDTTWADVARIVRARGIEASLPPHVRERLRAGLAGEIADTMKPEDPASKRSRLVVVCDGLTAARAAALVARGAGYEALVDGVWMTGDAGVVARDLADRARDLAKTGRPTALLRAGECTVSIRDGGRGGRCQHLALSFACERVAGATLAALATDGIDGPTDSAGAIVDDLTFDAVAHRGFDARAQLARFDSYPALDAAGALVRTGASGTNVGDVAMLLVTPRE